MSKSRTWAIGGVLAMIVVIVAGWMLGVSPILAQVSSVNAQASTIQNSNNASLAQLANLKVQFAHIGKQESQLSKLRLSVPQTAAASEFLQELSTLSVNAGVALTTVSVANATLYTAPVAAAPVTTSTTSTATPSPSAATTTVPAATPATTTGGLVLVPVSVSVNGAFNNVRDFVGAVQLGTRLYFASSVAITTDAATGTTTALITGDVFTLPGASGTKTAKVPSSDSVPTATPIPTATPTPTPTATTTTSGAKTGTNNTAPTTVVTPAPTPTPTPTDSTSP